jgi:hypothetical protein
VGGYEILDKIEEIETNKSDKPLKNIKIISTICYHNPFKIV